MDRKKGIRARRTEQVLRGVGGTAFGSFFVHGIVDSARLLLLKALSERRSRDGENFLTLYGPSAIVVAVTAFEVFINETLYLCLLSTTVNEADFQDLAQRDALADKFRDIPHLVTGGPELVNPEVVLMQHVRNEIVHYYPRPVGATNVPEWLQPLADRGLLYEDICWQQKLQSFQLARWCGQVASIAAQQFAEALAPRGEDERKLSLVAESARIDAAYFRHLAI